MAERFFVIGSNSFSGAWFVDRLLSEGASVVGISRSSEPNVVFLPYRWRAGGAALSRFRFQQLDLNHDTNAIADAIEKHRPDYVVNFAAQSMVAESWTNPDQWYQTNVVANVRLHDRIRRFDFIKKYVHASTPEVYGNCTGIVTEDARFNPSTPYAASRAGCDLHLMTYFRQYGFPVVLTRAANVFGPGQQLYRIVPRTILFLRLGRVLRLHGGGRSVRSLIHVRDVADGMLKLARDGRPPNAYHLATRSVHSIRDIVQIICRKLNTDFNRAVEIAADRPGNDAAYLLDTSRARNELGWTDRTSFEQGIDDTIAWVDRNFDTLKNLPFDYRHKP